MNDTNEDVVIPSHHLDEDPPAPASHCHVGPASGSNPAAGFGEVCDQVRHYSENALQYGHRIPTDSEIVGFDLGSVPIATPTLQTTPAFSPIIGTAGTDTDCGTDSVPGLRRPTSRIGGRNHPLPAGPSGVVRRLNFTSAPTVSFAGSPDPGQNGESHGSGRRGRGRSFTASEALQLAKAWVQQSGAGCNQREERMWEAIRKACTEKYGMNRTTHALKSKWKALSRECLHYIAAQTLVRTTLPSGRTLEEAGDQIMKIYCKRIGKRENNGTFKAGPPFQYFETAAFLATQPKWSDTDCNPGPMADRDVEPENTHAAPGTDGSGGELSDGLDGPSARPRGRGPRGRQAAGIKAAKAGRKRDAEAAGVKVELSGMRQEIAKVRRTMESIVAVQRSDSRSDQGRTLLEHLPPDSSARQAILDDLMEQYQSTHGRSLDTQVKSDGTPAGAPAGNLTVPRDRRVRGDLCGGGADFPGGEERQAPSS